MPVSDPNVLRRLTELRQVAALSSASLDELATLAETGHEETFATGDEVACGGAQLGGLHLILDGQIDTTEGRPRTWGPRDLFGFHETLAGRALAHRAVATSATRTLRLSSDELADLVEDNLGVMVSMMRELSRGATEAGIHVPGNPAWAMSTAAQHAGPLDLVERVILLRRQPVFARAHLQALFMLAQNASETQWSRGAVVLRAGERAGAILIIIAGTLTSDTGETFGPGEALGLTETVANVPVRASVTATTDSRAMVATGACLFDTLEDHPGLGTAMLASLAGALLDAAGR